MVDQQILTACEELTVSSLVFPVVKVLNSLCLKYGTCKGGGNGMCWGVIGKRPYSIVEF